VLEPAQLLAGEQAVITATPPDDELIGAQLATLEPKRDQAERERGRLLDAYQAALLNLDELTRRTAALTARRVVPTTPFTAAGRSATILATIESLGPPISVNVDVRE
jgi:hypothetical protein